MRVNNECQISLLVKITLICMSNKIIKYVFCM